MKSAETCSCSLCNKFYTYLYHHIVLLDKYIHCNLVHTFCVSCAMTQPVVGRLVTVEAQVHFHVGFCGGQSDIGERVSPRTAVFPCDSHSTIAPYSLVCCRRSIVIGIYGVVNL